MYLCCITIADCPSCSISVTWRVQLSSKPISLLLLSSVTQQVFEAEIQEDRQGEGDAIETQEPLFLPGYQAVECNYQLADTASVCGFPLSPDSFF